ncbi:LysM peptidoglycan-binding domain-containing protein [Hymenobacter nivis]|uniref:LysM peptidoglycan-binding domain-containing protein n=1 Tax=Hymenobacter nivis TaxID=1850093 RepID=A0A502GE31_9BACT|nr:LysM peptidoglycan-binding domain-containing protein [Hymenobacter nivis]TPG58963.1 LysM peptidoglycan-binding domain-containing protein [Hymenobacter nivis]
MTGFLLLLAATLYGPGAPAPVRALAPADSIGVEMRGGQRFVRHRVGAGETLSALSRRYHVSVAQLTAANPQVASGLGIGQVVLVPRPLAAGTPAAAAAAAPAAKAGGAAVPASGRYTVARGETLFAIARRFQLTPDDIIKLNNLPANGRVRVGQQLLLEAPAVATAAPALAATPLKTPAPTVAPVPDKPAQVATVTPAAPADRETERAAERAPTRASELAGRITDSGMAAGIDNNGTDKYLALHKTAPVGTIMQVKNTMNGQSVYVRVIGKLPDTGENNNILVRLSPRAVQKLGTSDQRFRVETSYVP